METLLNDRRIGHVRFSGRLSYNSPTFRTFDEQPRNDSELVDVQAARMTVSICWDRMGSFTEKISVIRGDDRKA